jgi:hypothetical protein
MHRSFRRQLASGRSVKVDGDPEIVPQFNHIKDHERRARANKIFTADECNQGGVSSDTKFIGFVEWEVSSYP